MKDLIEALTILSKYVDDEWPTNCGHDTLWVKGPPPASMQPGDAERLIELGFLHSDGEGWFSYRFGSC